MSTTPINASKAPQIVHPQHKSSEKLKILLSEANEHSTPIKERIALCSIVLREQPEHLEAKFLFLTLNQLKLHDKIKRLKQEVKEGPHPTLATSEAEIPLSSIGKAEWAAPHLIKNLPAYPQELKEFLATSCTIWPGRKRSETHIVVPLFKKITIDVNGSPVLVPRTLKTLGELDKSSGGPGFHFIWDKIPNVDPHWLVGECHYGVLTKDILHGTRNQPYNIQKELVESKGYKVPPILDAATAILWESRRTGIDLFNSAPKLITFTNCQDEFCRAIVGGLSVCGLDVRAWNDYGEETVYVGMAGFLEF